MSHALPLAGLRVAISISESPDLAVRGLSDAHLRDAMLETARHLLSLGADLAYGGDLRPDGFTVQLVELVARYTRELDETDQRPRVTNYLAWPVYRNTPPKVFEELAAMLGPAGELVKLDASGTPLNGVVAHAAPPRAVVEEDWGPALTAMRRHMSRETDARIVLGGRLTGFKGVLPGVVEEAIVALQDKKPLYLVGGFGGCAEQVAEALGLLPSMKQRPPWHDWQLQGFEVDDLWNGLTQEENETLARTVHVEQVITLVLRGLFRGAGEITGRHSRIDDA